jgi:hypothetical protein
MHTMPARRIKAGGADWSRRSIRPSIANGVATSGIWRS